MNWYVLDDIRLCPGHELIRPRRYTAMFRSQTVMSLPIYSCAHIRNWYVLPRSQTDMSWTIYCYAQIMNWYVLDNILLCPDHELICPGQYMAMPRSRTDMCWTIYGYAKIMNWYVLDDKQLCPGHKLVYPAQITNWYVLDNIRLCLDHELICPRQYMAMPRSGTDMLWTINSYAQIMTWYVLENIIGSCNLQSSVQNSRHMTIYILTMKTMPWQLLLHAQTMIAMLRQQTYDYMPSLQLCSNNKFRTMLWQ